ncbi:DeoR/GlpR family transcriptional regulator [Celerinatantimonas sp. MCCC 1A17872]|uniref:DeoR/GlpR family transcriptional regulator n=1 Tax=Celerinatantimonas sp. MCCC 1A17872 TaxID=3177514 RepID=UPI0038C68660
MKQSERHSQIIGLLGEHGFLSTEELVNYFGVSSQTIRRDLNDLAAQRRIQRHHGGASLQTSTENDPYPNRKMAFLQAKERIANAIAEQIPHGASLFIDIGTTAEAVAQALLQHKGLRIVTNNINVASTLLKNEDCMVILAGGEVRHRDGGIIGEATRDFIQQFRMDYGILGISGIDEDGSLLDFDYHEVRVKQAIIANARHTFLAADASKFGRNAMVNMGNITQIGALYTDVEPPKKISELLSANHIECHLC